MSFARKLARRSPPQQVPQDPIPFSKRPRGEQLDVLAGLVEAFPEGPRLWSKALRARGGAPLDLALALVHVEATAWLRHLGVALRPGESVCPWAQRGFLWAGIFVRDHLGATHPRVRDELDAAAKEAWRIDPKKSGIALVVFADTSVEAFSYEALPRLVTADVADLDDYGDDRMFHD